MSGSPIGNFLLSLRNTSTSVSNFGRYLDEVFTCFLRTKKSRSSPSIACSAWKRKWRTNRSVQYVVPCSTTNPESGKNERICVFKDLIKLKSKIRFEFFVSTRCSINTEFIPDRFVTRERGDTTTNTRGGKYQVINTCYDAILMKKVQLRKRDKWLIRFN